MIISLFKISILPFFVSISSEILSSFNTRDKDCALTFKSIAICFCEIVSKFFLFPKDTLIISSLNLMHFEIISFLKF